MVGISAYGCKEVKALGPARVTTGFGPSQLRFPSWTMELSLFGGGVWRARASPGAAPSPVRTGHGQPGWEGEAFPMYLYKHFCKQTYKINIITGSKPEQWLANGGVLFLLLFFPSLPLSADSSGGGKRNMCCPSSGPASPSCSPLSPGPWRSPAGERRELGSPELPAPPRGP